jgi:hypothetical protein
MAKPLDNTTTDGGVERCELDDHLVATHGGPAGPGWDFSAGHTCRYRAAPGGVRYLLVACQSSAVML